MPVYQIVILMIAAGILFPFIGGPLLILATFKLKSPTRIVYFQPGTMALPLDVKQFVVPACRQLVRLGFRPVAYFKLPNLVSNAESINVLLINEATSEGAMVNCLYADALIGTIKTKYVEFYTRFRDGVTVQTNNSKQLSAFTNAPDEHTIQFWDTQDVGELYRRHVAISKALGTGPRRNRLAEEFRDDVGDYLQEAVVREPADYQVELGLLQRVKGGYTTTLKGAVLFTWKEMWPWKLFRKAARRSEARRWLDEIGDALDDDLPVDTLDFAD